MNHDNLVERLDRALDELTAVRVELGGVDLTPPDDGLDAALGADDNYRERRVALRDAIEALLDARLGDDLRGLVLKVEEAANHQLSVAVEVGWRVGMQAGLRVRDSGSGR